jgi:hypothetical protein
LEFESMVIRIFIIDYRNVTITICSLEKPFIYFYYFLWNFYIQLFFFTISFIIPMIDAKLFCLSFYLCFNVDLVDLIGEILQWK